jgi:hypothetical protein
MTNEEQIVQLLKEILEEQKKTVKELADIKNLFLKYDMEEFLNDEHVRMGIKNG